MSAIDKMATDDKHVIIAKEEYLKLLNAKNKLECLETDGVENWADYDYAMVGFEPITKLPPDVWGLAQYLNKALEVLEAGKVRRQTPGQKIRKHRERAGNTLAWTARYLQMSVEMLDDIENDKISRPPSFIYELEDVLGIDCSELKGL